MPQKSFYGGQAIIEGVMIRGKENISIAVRCPDEHIDLHVEPIRSIFGGPLRKIPLIRGFLVLLEVLIIGTRALIRSARLSLEEDPDESYSLVLWATVAAGLVIGVGIFFVFPVFVQEWLDSYVESSVQLNLIEGGLRLGLFLGYLRLIGFMGDVRRVFQYHGAEHMSIHAYEHGESLDTDSVRKYTTLHPRCGTAFLLVVVVVAIVVFVLLGHPPLWLRIVSRIVLLPVVAGIAYEIIRFHGAHTDNRILKVLLSPGLALQKLTTRRPDDSQIEVAITALNGALEADGVAPTATPEQGAVDSSSPSSIGAKGSNPAD